MPVGSAARSLSRIGCCLGAFSLSNGLRPEPNLDIGGSKHDLFCANFERRREGLIRNLAGQKTTAPARQTRDRAEGEELVGVNIRAFLDALSGLSGSAPEARDDGFNRAGSLGRIVPCLHGGRSYGSYVFASLTSFKRVASPIPATDRTNDLGAYAKLSAIALRQYRFLGQNRTKKYDFPTTAVSVRNTG